MLFSIQFFFNYLELPSGILSNRSNTNIVRDIDEPTQIVSDCEPTIEQESVDLQE